MRNSNIAGLSLFAVALTCVTAQRTLAADDNWTNATTSPAQEWTTAGNWSLGAAPTAAQSAGILNGGAAKIDTAVTFSTLTIDGGSQLQILDGANLSGGGAVTNNGSLGVNTFSRNLTISNVIGGTGSLTINNGGGGGSFIITGANTYSGGTFVGGGTGNLYLSGSGTLGSVAGALTISGGSVNLGGTTQV